MVGGRGVVGRRARLMVVAVAALFVLSASPAGAAAVDDPRVPLVIAHRGASAAAPEHTFAAYDRAVEAHADVIECDLQLTKDGVLVCMHDTTVDRTTGGTATGRVDSFTLAQLRTMDFGSWFGPEFAGAAIVPFEEQLRCYRKTGVQFYAETKAPAEYGGRMEPALVALLRRLHLIPRGPADPSRSPVIVQSFDGASLQAVKRLAPSLPAALLWVTPPSEASAGPRVEIAAPTASYLLAQPQMVTLEHQHGHLVHTWTVDDPAEMAQLLDAGVDGIFTNHADVLRGIVDRRTGRATRPAVRLQHGCPGIAGTVTAATDDQATPTSVASRTTPTSARTSGDDDVDWVPFALGAAAIVVVAGIIGWVLRRRSPR